MSLRLRRWLGWALCLTVSIVTPLTGLAAESRPPTAPTALSNINDDAFQWLRAADVVYLGEQHDRMADHRAQLAIMAGLYAENPDLAIALEMFQRPFQPAIDRYLVGDITEADLITQTEYQERWGFPWEFYAPFLRFARTHQLPVLALNAPTEITRQIASEGLDSLEGDDLSASRFCHPERNGV